MKIAMSTTIDIDHKTTVAELTKVFSTLPPLAKVSITEEKYQDPRDPGRKYMTITWTEER